MNLFNSTESLSLDGMLVITCERSRVAWNRGLKKALFMPASAETRAKMSAARKGVKVGPTGPKSAEHRAKLSAALKGRPTGPKSAEHLAKIGAALKGRIRSAETRAKLSAANKGRPRSAESRAKISAANKGKIRPAEHQAKINAALRGRSVKGEIMTPWGKYHSSNMAKDCGTMLGVTQPVKKIALGLITDPENYYYIPKDTK